ncbi:hypothetical protein MATL_G00063290 [Megalops atlanticus]|uniref:Proepiregulin n=1 Tax=Megalops atlanticus TaxID=7932 RepID=A0A9D3Q8C7_MEGAT|nr:hypothetical protein MATL_G00063290 [Megalops atlanticus]
MKGFRSSCLLSLYGLLLLWPHAHSTSPSPTSGSVDTPHVERVMIQKCNSSMEEYCFHGECMFLLDLKEHHCRCDKGYAGHRCAHLELVFQPLSQEYIVLTVVCVVFVVLGITGTAYFFYKWYKRNRCPPAEKYQEVQMA